MIAIIGILATLATVSLNSARSKARDAKRISDLKQMGSAMELYNTDNNTYVGGCVAGVIAAGSFTPTTSCLASGGASAYISWATIKDPQTPVTCATSAPSEANKCYMATKIISAPETFAFCAYFENANSGIGLTAPGVACYTNTGWKLLASI